MSARSQRGLRDSSPVKKLATPRFSGQNRGQKMPTITYDYDAAVSQPDVPNFLDLKKNGRYPMKRYQAPGTKRVKYNAQSPTGKTADCTKESVASGSSNDEKDENENVGNGGVVDVENLTNFLKQTTEAQNLSYKITTIELIGKGNSDQTVENDIENEKAKENEEPVEYKNVAKLSVPPVKGSRIPRAKIIALPIQTVQEFRSGKKTTASRKLKDCTNSKCPPTCDQNNIDVSEKEATTVQSDQVRDEIKNEKVHYEKTVKDTKIVWDDEKTSETEAEGDRALSSTDESTPIIDGLHHPQVLSILQNLKLNCPCTTCTNQNLPSSSRPDDDSDVKSSSPEKCKKKKWPLRHRKYVDTSSEGTSSDRYNDKERMKKRSKSSTVKNPPILREKTSSLINVNPKGSDRQRSNFSFFNALFDIVFWPYVFLKSNR
ncbi:uncharacterized protein LOC143212283 isoform X2 [Lasioglossum baleicum]|uniref:uncharacterized protein LOC143212283 isoform X2 n=1 Tax=Lasioglossum baleicum TaxID=434251 RepID=UPI003FCC353C